MRARSLLRLALGAGPLDRTGAVSAWVVSAALLAPRLWLAWIFLASGLTRVQHWSAQTFLFSQIHPVPFLPPGIAAVVTTAAELALPVLLVAGLLGRVAALGALAMAMTIEFVVARTPEGLENGIANPEHYLWMLAALVVVVLGPGRLALDRLLLRWWPGLPPAVPG